MHAITPWNPFKEMEELQDRVTSLLGLAPVRARRSDERMTVADWAPLVDVTENEKEYVIKADLPDLEKKDINVQVENGVLYISGERKREKEESGKKFHRVERFFGNFVRSFTIPEDAETSEINAGFKNGVLTVHLAKSEAARPKNIDIKVG